MKPYYEHAGMTLYLGDCREVLPRIGGFDFVLTDPPYELEAKGGGHRSSAAVSSRHQGPSRRGIRHGDA